MSGIKGLGFQGFPHMLCLGFQGFLGDFVKLLKGFYRVLQGGMEPPDECTCLLDGPGCCDPYCTFWILPRSATVEKYT